MICKYCGFGFKFNKYTEPNVCPDCSGVTEDFEIEDTELTVDIWKLRNPSGKTQAVFEKEEEYEN